jgi:hypothetical protein
VKTEWQTGSKNQKTYSRRKLIVELIAVYATKKRISKDAAAITIEEKRLQSNLSLLQLADK